MPISLKMVILNNIFGLGFDSQMSKQSKICLCYVIQILKDNNIQIPSKSYFRSYHWNFIKNMLMLKFLEAIWQKNRNI